MSSKDNKGETRDDKPKSSASSPRSHSPSHSSSPRSPRKSSYGGSTARSETRLSSRYQKSPNKIYRCPPTPPPEEHRQLEKSFVLDSNAVSSIYNDYSKTNPKLGTVCAPYNSQLDNSAQNYFRFYGVDQTLKRTGQYRPGTSIEGNIQDKFHRRGPGFLYLVRRNVKGPGHSNDNINGHSEFLRDIRPIYSYNGAFGFRRNTPWLRACPSPFGTGRSPIY